MKTILLVDDEEMIRMAFSAHLEDAGYRVITAASVAEGLDMYRSFHPDLILADVMMPGANGYEFCFRLRQLDRETPFVFLSALDSEEDQVKGLEFGADDYLSKTASPDLILSRLKKTLERAANLAAKVAPQSMTRTEANIYRLLESEPGRYFTYREIFAAVLGDGYYADEGTIRSHVSRLRKKLPKGSEIEARRGFGFRIVES